MRYARRLRGDGGRFRKLEGRAGRCRFRRAGLPQLSRQRLEGVGGQRPLSEGDRPRDRLRRRFTAERGFGLYVGEPYAAMLRAVTGWDVSAEELERTGERIVNLERLFNVREGVRRGDDRLPWRVMHEPIPSGPSAGMYCPPAELDAMLDEYYRLRGWDTHGVPTPGRLSELGL